MYHCALLTVKKCFLRAHFGFKVYPKKNYQHTGNSQNVKRRFALTLQLHLVQLLSGNKTQDVNFYRFTQENIVI